MPDPLPTRLLGRTGIKLSALGMGTWGLCSESYGKVFPEQRARTLTRAVDQGLTVFDMAPWWGTDGASEREVKEAVGTRRDEMVYVTRAGLLQRDLAVEAAFDTEALTEQCEASLRRLDTDHIDLWLLHEPSEADLRREELRDAAEGLHKQGKVRAWGVATSSHDVARAALEAGAQALCVPFNLHRPRLVWDLATDASARGVGILARSILMHGLLAGRWNNKKRFAPDDHRTHRWNADALGERVQQTTDLRFLVHGAALSMASAAQRFVLAHDVVTCALIGPRTPGQVEAAINALGGDEMMSAEDLERVRKLTR